MNSAFIWIVIPILWGIAALGLRRFGAALFLISAALSLILAWAASQLPIDTALEFASSTLKISPSINILGRSFTLQNADRPLLTFVYLANTLWLLGAFFARPSTLFVGISQISVALFIAAISVDPFLYAAIFIAVVVLINVPLLVSPGRKVNAGLLRYMSFQLFGLPFILLLGWLLTGVEASPSNSALVISAGLLLALGFAFLLAIVPFHSWLPMLAEASHPFNFGFIVFFLPFAVTLLALGFFERFAWLRDTQSVFTILIALGAMVTALGGIWAAIQNHLGRQLGYAVVLESGLTLVALGISGGVAVQLIMALIIARLLSLLTWVIALAGLRQASGGSLDIDAVSRNVSRHPILLVTLLLAMASFAGLPLSVSFAPKLMLLQLAWQQMPLAALAILIGQLAMLLALIRLFFALALPAFSNTASRATDSLLGAIPDPLIPDVENPYTWLYLAIWGGLLLLFSIFPQKLIGDLSAFLGIFPQLAP